MGGFRRSVNNHDCSGTAHTDYKGATDTGKMDALPERQNEISFVCPSCSASPV